MNPRSVPPVNRPIAKTVIFRRPHRPAAETGRRPSWRDYQVQLKRRRSGVRIRRPLMLKSAAILVAVGLLAWSLLDGPASSPPPVPSPGPAQAAVGPTAGPLLSKSDVQDLLAGRPVADLLEERTQVRWGEQKLVIEPSIDQPLQAYLTKRLYERTSRYIGIVVMEAQGRVLAMVGFDKNDPEGNPCLSNRYPAASVFKIVTAGAAIEHCHLSSGSPMTYNGAKHTLYKSQLKDIKNRYTHQTTLAASFAQSVNPVFGKLGSLCLKQETLAHYAEVFGFNHPIPFELPVPPSRAPLTDDPYQWAEVASGFNRQTVISPLHGALLAAVALNGGRLVEPTIVDRITGPDGQVLYRPDHVADQRAVTSPTAKEMARLMRETVRRGTARKQFRSRTKDRVLSQLEIGGKTGSIDNADHDVRYDWFVGFARYPNSQDAIAVAAVVAHEKYIGRRAGEYARMAMTEYFRPRIASQE